MVALREKNIAMLTPYLTNCKENDNKYRIINIIKLYTNRKIFNYKTALNVIKLLASTNKHIVKHNKAIKKYDDILQKCVNIDEAFDYFIENKSDNINNDLVLEDLIFVNTETIHHDISTDESLKFEDIKSDISECSTTDDIVILEDLIIEPSDISNGEIVDTTYTYIEDTDIIMYDYVKKPQDVWFPDDIFQNILTYSIEGIRFLQNIKLQTIGGNSADKTLLFKILNQDIIDNFKGYMNYDIDIYGITKFNEKPFTKCPTIEIKYRDLSRDTSEPQILPDYGESEFDRYIINNDFTCDLKLSLAREPIILNWKAIPNNRYDRNN